MDRGASGEATQVRQSVVRRRRDAWSAIPYKRRQAIKTTLAARDGLICCVCRTAIASLKAATIEHKVERSDGGALLAWDNLALAHAHCNYGRRGKKLSAKGNGALGVVEGAAFFDAERRQHPAPPVFPSPGRSEKIGGEQG